jgi:hypothetical protein
MRQRIKDTIELLTLLNLVRHRRRGFSMLLIILMSTQAPNLMRSHINICPQSSKNLVTIYAEDMKLIVDAM